MVVQNYLMSEQIGGASQGRRKQKRAELRNEAAQKKCVKDDFERDDWVTDEVRTQGAYGKIDFYTSINQAFACGEKRGNKFSLGEMPKGSFIKMTAGEQKGKGIFKIISYISTTGNMKCQLMRRAQGGPPVGGAIVNINASDNARWYGGSMPPAALRTRAATLIRKIII
jgi:hypothetical protein